MAECIPNTLDDIDFTTSGEKRVFAALKQLPDNCYIWYEVVLHERNYRPDFMILDPVRGVQIIEVKDWSIDAIVNASPRQFVIKWKDNVPQERMNPKIKCQRYLATAKEKLEINEELVDEYERLLVPINYFIAFPNMAEIEFDEGELGAVIDREQVLFKEDIRSASRFVERLYSSQPELSEPLATSQIRLIRQKLRSEVTVEPPSHKGEQGLIPTGNGGIVTSGKLNTEFAIDIEQEKVAKNMGEGPRLLRGMAGSGKTLILLARAKPSVP